MERSVPLKINEDGGVAVEDMQFCGEPTFDGDAADEYMAIWISNNLSRFPALLNISKRRSMLSWIADNWPGKALDRQHQMLSFATEVIREARRINDQRMAFHKKLRHDEIKSKFDRLKRDIEGIFDPYAKAYASLLTPSEFHSRYNEPRFGSKIPDYLTKRLDSFLSHDKAGHNIFSETYVDRVAADQKHGFFQFKIETNEFKGFKSSLALADDLIDVLHSKNLYGVSRINIVKSPILVPATELKLLVEMDEVLPLNIIRDLMDKFKLVLQAYNLSPLITIDSKLVK